MDRVCSIGKKKQKKPKKTKNIFLYKNDKKSIFFHKEINKLKNKIVYLFLLVFLFV